MDKAYLEPDSSNVAVADRRRSERVAAHVPGWISAECTDRGAKGRDITINDLSMHGVGFNDVSHKYRVGASHWLVINGGAMRMSTRIRIVGCRQNADGSFDIGARFF